MMTAPRGKHSGSFDARSVVVIACSSLGLYNALELILLIFTTFKHYAGLYFWALLIAAFGIIPYVIGWLVVYFDLTHNWVGFIIDSYGWCTMVTGQSVVLYSRLHFVLKNSTLLRAVKWMIIIDAVIFHTSTTVVLFGSNIGDDQMTFNKAWNTIEKVQMTGFCIQEFIISGLYVWKTVDLLQVVKKPGTKRVMWHLFIINIIIITMDIALLVIEYCNLRVMEQAFKVVIYSIKLKLEFAILGQLVELVQQNGHRLSDAFSDAHEYVDMTTSSSHHTTIVSGVQMTHHPAPPHQLDSYEKGSAFQHVENYQEAKDETKEQTNIFGVNLSPHQASKAGDLITPVPRPARMRSDSDLTYAEIMRSISITTSK